MSLASRLVCLPTPVKHRHVAHTDVGGILQAAVCLMASQIGRLQTSLERLQAEVTALTGGKTEATDSVVALVKWRWRCWYKFPFLLLGT